MKKNYIYVGIIVLIIIANIVVFLLLTFSNKEIICTSKSDQSKNGYILETTYKIKYKNEMVTSINIKEIITSKDKKKLKSFAKQFEEQYEYNKKTYGGYTYKVTNKDGKVESDVTVDYKEMDMKKFIKNNEAMKKFTNDNKLTLEGAKKLYESTGAKCDKK